MSEEHTFLCNACGERHPIGERTIFDEQALCALCLETTTLICEDCGCRIWRDDNAGNGTVPLCQYCYEHDYIECTRCGTLVREEDARYQSGDPDSEEALCSGCYHNRGHRSAINDYCYKPTPIFYGEGPRFFGVELEIDGAGELSESAERILEIANADGELAYCKHDGSLGEGFEIVTHPMSLDFHLERMPWEAVLEEAIALGYFSHQIRTCGLHVHVSRAAFGRTEGERDACIARILYFVEKHWEELLKFSRRTESQLRRWAARYGYKERPMEILDHAKKGVGVGRYTSVNLENRDTIEFRVFRGTLKYNTLIATLQMVDHICDVALSLSDDQLKAMPWTTFVSGCREPELVQYLKERRLYVNDPVAMEVEL